jgi:predicted metalloprotease
VQERRAIEEFLGLVARSRSLATADAIQKGLVVNQLAKLLGLPSEEVYRHLSVAARRVESSAGGSASLATGPRRAVGNAEAAATLELLEVLLNEPSYYDSIDAYFRPESLVDERDLQIALGFAGAMRAGGPFSLADFLGRFEALDVAERVTELHLAGERRGNFAATVEGAVVRLQQVREQRRTRELVAVLRESDVPAAAGVSVGAAVDPGDEAVRLQAMQQAARRTPQFAGLRHVSGRRKLAEQESQRGGNETTDVSSAGGIPARRERS